MNLPEIEYRTNFPLPVADIITVLESSGIRRPTGDPARIERMFASGSLIVSAWAGSKLVGICRALTDYAYCCYLSDLAVCAPYQHRGIGRGLVARLRENLGEEVSLLLLSAPEALEYYPKLGFSPLENGFLIRRGR